jgi:hypothetical protein
MVRILSYSSLDSPKPLDDYPNSQLLDPQVPGAFPQTGSYSNYPSTDHVSTPSLFSKPLPDPVLQSPNIQNTDLVKLVVCLHLPPMSPASDNSTIRPRRSPSASTGSDSGQTTIGANWLGMYRSEQRVEVEFMNGRYALPIMDDAEASGSPDSPQSTRSSGLADASPSRTSHSNSSQTFEVLAADESDDSDASPSVKRARNRDHGTVNYFICGGEDDSSSLILNDENKETPVHLKLVGGTIVIHSVYVEEERKALREILEHMVRVAIFSCSPPLKQAVAFCHSDNDDRARYAGYISHTQRARSPSQASARQVEATRSPFRWAYETFIGGQKGAS